MSQVRFAAQITSRLKYYRMMSTSQEPRWLDTDQQQVWIALAYTLNRLPAALDARLQQDAGLNTFEYMVLSGLSMSPERTLRMSELADFAGSSLSRLSNVVARLEKRGWLRRHTDPQDGRCTLATLTDDGWNKVVTSAPHHVTAVRHLVFDPLTKTQQRHLGEITRRVLHTIDEDDRSTS